MLNMASICSPTSFLIASCMRVNTVIFYRHSIIHGHRIGLLLLKRVSPSKIAILPQFSSSDGFYLYFHELQL